MGIGALSAVAGHLGGLVGFLIQVFEEDEVAGFKLSASEKRTWDMGRSICRCVCVRNLHSSNSWFNLWPKGISGISGISQFLHPVMGVFLGK